MKIGTRTSRPFLQKTENPVLLEKHKNKVMFLTGQMSAFLRIVPSPLQGTSHRIRSNRKSDPLETLRFGIIEAS